MSDDHALNYYSLSGLYGMESGWQVLDDSLHTYYKRGLRRAKKWKNHKEKATQGKNNIEVSIMIAIEALGSEVTGSDSVQR